LGVCLTFRGYYYQTITVLYMYSTNYNTVSQHSECHISIVIPFSISSYHLCVGFCFSLSFCALSEFISFRCSTMAMSHLSRLSATASLPRTVCLFGLFPSRPVCILRSVYVGLQRTPFYQFPFSISNQYASPMVYPRQTSYSTEQHQKEHKKDEEQGTVIRY
jgi:hypothetical protein